MKSSDKIRVRYTVTPQRIDYLKAMLADFLPDVPASHRVEALARGLEFRTWASLLAWKKTTHGEDRYIDEEAFNKYLASKGFAASPLAFESAMSMTRPNPCFHMPLPEDALASMGWDTWDSWGTGNRAYEDKMNAQIKFVSEAHEAADARRAARQSRPM
ncbi:hypothetical protein OIU34_19550 [Pararhizobium sp. BT-229]|uniref:hypothetical protein n=1 Tax=Pararhizobium sp. BT-229 TaxID=2986923 RepID=UPI0021F7552A|nr:hypothetical protein [Pararhizobium sp. BT-229]MCV9964080.1 hypothetical protein [Pararhizobium sp. BT-229]